MLCRVVGAALCALLATACSAPAVFGCDADTQCTQDGSAGTCELNGFCSFDDGECDSGRRYGSLAGNGLAGRCVLDPDGSGSNSVGSTTMDPPQTGTTVDAPAPGSSGSSGSSSGMSSEPASSSSGGTGGTTEVTDGPMIMPEDGLVVRFSFEERADTTVGAYDLSGNGLDATCGVGECPELVPGVVGNAASFDGVTDRLEVADDPLLRFTDAMSISAWLLYEGGPGVSIAVGKPFEDEDRNSYELYINHQETAVLLWSTDANPMGEAAATDDAVFAPDQWKHVVGTYDAGQMTLYIDNQLVASASAGSLVYDDSPLTVGGDISGDKLLYFFRGAIDEVRIYDRVLTHGEVEVLYGELQRP